MVPRWRILRKPQKRGAVREDDVRHRVAEAAISQGDLDFELKEVATRIALAETNTFAVVFNEPRDSGVAYSHHLKYDGDVDTAALVGNTLGEYDWEGEYSPCVKAKGALELLLRVDGLTSAVTAPS